MALLFLTLVAVAFGAPATQIRITFSPNTEELYAGWTSAGAAPPGAALLQAGASPTALLITRPGVSTTFTNEFCANASGLRTSHAAAFPAPAGSTTYYRVSADGGASWSATFAAQNPARTYPVTVALWGDLGVECGGVLPPSPGFAGGQCTAVPQLATDSAGGAHQYTLHFGDTASVAAH
jgi:hypothetical protein